MATHLSVALHKLGNQIVQVYSRSEESAQYLANRCGAEAVTDLDLLCDNAQLYIISVKDDVIASIAAKMRVSRNSVVVHTAGSVDMAVLSGVTEHYGVIYPLQTFSRARAVNWKQIPLYLEASDDTTGDFLHGLASQLSEKVRFVSSSKRQYLHLSAVFANNFTNYCYSVADKLLSHCGVPFNDLLPLIDETASKIHVLSPKDAQTGPAVRYDRRVLEKQSALLDGWPDNKQLYDVISRNIHKDHLLNDDIIKMKGI